MSTIVFLRTALFRLRHPSGIAAAIWASWSPISRGVDAYQPLADHGECGFLCMFLIAALFWWSVGIIKGAAIWTIIVLILRQLRVRKAVDANASATSS